MHTNLSQSNLLAHYPVKKDYPFLLVILLFATFLRLNHLNQVGLWLDEVSYTIAAQRPIINQILDPTNTLGDYLSVDPTLSALPFSLALKLGFSNFLARFPAAIFGVLGVALSYKLGRILFGNTIGLTASFLLCISSFHIYYSQEARSYAQFAFFCMASFLFLYQAVTKNYSSFWVLYGLSTWGGISTNHLMLFAVAVQGLFIIFVYLQHIIRQQNHSVALKILGQFLLTLAIVFTLRLPWISDFSQRQCYGCTIGHPSYALNLMSSSWNSLLVFTSPNIAVTVLWISLAIWGAVLALSNSPLSGVLLTFWFIFSIFITIIGLWFISQFYHPRYIIWGLPAFLLLAACGIIGLGAVVEKNLLNHHSLKPYIKLILLVALLIPFTGSNFSQINQHLINRQHAPRGQLQEVAEFILSEAYANDTVIAIGLPAVHLQFYIEPTRQDLTYFDDSLFVERIAAQTLPTEFQRRWYVLHNSYSPPNIPPKWVHALDYKEFHDIVVVHMPNKCSLENCIQETKTLLTEIAAVNPGSRLAEAISGVIAGFEILENY